MHPQRCTATGMLPPVSLPALPPFPPSTTPLHVSQGAVQISRAPPSAACTPDPQRAATTAGAPARRPPPQKKTENEKKTKKTPTLTRAPTHLHAHEVGGDSQDQPHLAALIHLQRHLAGPERACSSGMFSARLLLAAGASAPAPPEPGPFRTIPGLGKPSTSRLSTWAAVDGQGSPPHGAGLPPPHPPPTPHPAPPASCPWRWRGCRAARAACPCPAPSRLPCMWSARCPGCI